MNYSRSQAKAGVQTPEGLKQRPKKQESLRFACDDWAPAFAGEQERP